MEWETLSSVEMQPYSDVAASAASSEETVSWVSFTFDLK